MSPAPTPRPSVSYSERLHAPVSWWIGVLVMMFILGLEILPLLPVSAWLTMGLPILIAALLLASAGLNRIQIVDGVLRTNRWSLPCSQVASVEELDRRNTRRFAGPAGDPAAVTLVRPWIGTSVRVICVADEPPYALLSTRRPEKLSAAIVACASMTADERSGEG